MAPPAKCDAVPIPPEEPRRLILLSAPCVDKGAIAALLQHCCGACHLSTEDVSRAAQILPSGARTPALEDALGCMARGQTVPDETVLALVRERVACLRCAGGFVLDGFPRTVAQAEALDRLLEAEDLTLTAVLDYELPMKKMVNLLAGRRICASCNIVFCLTDKSPAPGTCPSCGNRLNRREGDRPEAIRARMEAYQRGADPLLRYYRRRGLLLTVSAEGTPPEILRRTVDALAWRAHVCS